MLIILLDTTISILFRYHGEELYLIEKPRGSKTQKPSGLRSLTPDLAI